MTDQDAPLVLLSHDILAMMRNPLAAQGYRVISLAELTPETRAEVRAIAHAGDTVLGPELLSQLPGLEIIAAVPVGYDGVDVPWCRANGVAVTHAHALNTEDVADHTLGLLIASWRDIVSGDAYVREGRWLTANGVSVRPGLKGLKVGVIGLGSIGAAVARRVEALGMKVTWWGPNPKPEAPWPRAASVLDLAAGSDILAVTCRADASNQGLVSREVIEAVGPEGLIVNVSRGSIVDEDALIAALKEGRLGRAALDVFAQEPTPAERWADVPRIVLTPHSAGATTEAITRMFGQTLENLRRQFAGEALLSPVAE